MLSVLVIDDEYGVRTGIREILVMEGYDVEVAETGRHALERLEARPFDIALIDYQLPDIDGLTLLQAIRERKLGTLTCMITAYANIDTAIAATRQGIDFFLPKPFSPDDLLGVIETLAAHKRLKEETERLRRAHEASLSALATEKSQTSKLLASLRDAVLVVNREEEVVLVNQAMAALLGEEQATLLHQPLAEVLRKESLTPLLALIFTLGDEDRKVLEVTLDDRIYFASAVAFHGDQRTVLGRILTLADVTDLRRMAMEKPRFIRTMVHEFRSPLGAIRSLIEVALERSLGNELSPYLPFLERADCRIDKLAELIGDLLSLSRIDLEHVKSEGAADLASCVATVVDLYQERVQARGIRILFGSFDGIPSIPIGEEDLKTVLGNLVGNAIKYGRDNGKVEIRTRVADPMFFIEVADDGIGIRPENLPRLFDEFFREKRAETQNVEGNGLGLSIVKRLVERAQGSIKVESHVGEGTTFTLAFTTAGEFRDNPQPIKTIG
jgi:two-component system phosphate regulon sensor histidine kinase PhoR